MIARTVKTYGRPDVLFNNAGIQFSKNVEQTTLKDWRRIMRVNVDGVFLGTKYAIGAMKRGKRGGSIINMSSTYGMVGDDMLLIARTVKTYGRPDVLFNNAGIQFSKNVEQTTLKDWRRIMRVNVDGVFLGTKYAIGAMKRGKRGGSIINMSSTYGMVGDDLNAAYCATKAAVMNFTKAAALHCGKAGYGIRVNSIHPGAIRTPLTDRELVDITRKRKLKGTQVALKEWVAIHPIGRIGVPDDIAYGALYLASDESRFMTGAELVIDGGMLAQ